jgi:hypothetical protein
MTVTVMNLIHVGYTSMLCETNCARHRSILDHRLLFVAVADKVVFGCVVLPCVILVAE